MTPYQRLTVFISEYKEWTETAKILRQWCSRPDIEAIPVQVQEEKVCAHMVRVWSYAVLSRDPNAPDTAAAFRDAPTGSDWTATERITARYYIKTKLSSRVVGRNHFYLARNMAFNAAGPRARDWISEPVNIEARESATNAYWTAVFSASIGIPSGFLQAAEEWIFLAEPQAPEPWMRELLDPHASPDPDAYAIAWDALVARLDTGGTDDGRRICHGLDANGAPLPVWARRTALARCLLRPRVSR